MRVSERVKNLWEKLRFAAMCVWFGVKTAMTFGVPLIIGWLSIPFFQSLALSLQGTNIEFFLPILTLFVATIGASSVGALLYWGLWGINPFEGVETQQKGKPFKAKTYLEMMRKEKRKR